MRLWLILFMFFSLPFAEAAAGSRCVSLMYKVGEGQQENEPINSALRKLSEVESDSNLAIDLHEKDLGDQKKIRVLVIQTSDRKLVKQLQSDQGSNQKHYQVTGLPKQIRVNHIKGTLTLFGHAAKEALFPAAMIYYWTADWIHNLLHTSIWILLGILGTGMSSYHAVKALVLAGLGIGFPFLTIDNYSAADSSQLSEELRVLEQELEASEKKELNVIVIHPLRNGIQLDGYKRTSLPN